MASKSRLDVSVIAGGAFYGKSVTDVQWLPDSTAFTFTKTSKIYRHDVITHSETQVFPSSPETQSLDFSEYSTTDQQNYLLIAGKKKQIWRHSFAAPYYIYDMETKGLFPIAGGDSNLQNVTLSPDNKFVAFVKGLNLYVTPCKGGEVRQLTEDGSDNVLNGIFDWVYEEEFGRADAYRWSPDSKKIAFWRTDQTRVKSFPIMDDTSSNYPTITELKYPKVGELNSIVKIGVVDIETKTIHWPNLSSNETEDFYIPRIDWTTSSNVLAIQKLNRKQNHLQLLFADLLAGQTKVILTDESKTGWIDITDDFIFFKNKDEFIWTTEKDGRRQIYHADYSGRQIKQVTKETLPALDITSVIGFDEANGWIYFYGPNKPENRVVYRINLDGTKHEIISSPTGYTEAKFSPNYQYYFATRSTARTPDQYFLYDSTGKQLTVLEANEIPALSTYHVNFPEFEEITINDEQGNPLQLSAYTIKPSNFDKQKKYPVIVFVYSGPALNLVLNKWIRQRALWHSMLAEMGAIIFCCDHRGAACRGVQFKHFAYGDISKYAVMDQISAVKYLQTLPYVDSKRIGVWGWSGGGYLTAMLMTRGAEYFSCGIAVAPVTDFRNYDTIWTERYMGLLSENKGGYDAADVLTYVNNLSGPLLLVHGSGDDNVHPQNTMMMVDKLIAANKQFELMIYPNRNHGIYGNNATRHLFTMMTNFFVRHLKL